MSVAKEIVELQGGRFENPSQPDKVTRVTLWLPLAQRADHAVQRALELSQPQAV